MLSLTQVCKWTIVTVAVVLCLSPTQGPSPGEATFLGGFGYRRWGMYGYPYMMGYGYPFMYGRMWGYPYMMGGYGMGYGGMGYGGMGMMGGMYG